MTEAPTAAEELTLADGARIEIRPLVPDDRERLELGFAKLSPESRYKRFLRAIDKLTPQQIEYLTCVDGRDHIACGAGVIDPVSHALEGIGIARSVRDDADPRRAEFAIAIADEWQHRGVGRRLARAVAERAWRTGVRQWHATMFATNVDVLGVLRGVADESWRRADGHGGVEVVFDLKPPESR